MLELERLQQLLLAEAGDRQLESRLGAWQPRLALGSQCEVAGVLLQLAVHLTTQVQLSLCAVFLRE
jgi:hypothetical protein